MTPAYTVTNESITVILDGKPYTVREGSPHFEAAREAVLRKQWDKIRGFASPGSAIEHWLSNGFALTDGFITYRGQRIDSELNTRMQRMASEGANPSGWLKFWARLQENPSWRSVKQLYGFLAHKGIPIDEDTGHILAYKSVTRDYKDHHTRNFDNSPGTVQEMPRNQISDDPNHACHEGFHVGALDYARGFGGTDKRIIVVSIDPADVVSVPYDSSQQKMRVCRYRVVGNYAGQPMHDTHMRDDRDDPIEPDDDSIEPDDDSIETDRDDSIETDDDSIDDDSLEAEETDLTWDHLNRMDGKALDGVDLSTLRKYARHALEIFGASKLRGGKAALIKRILEVRRK